jgi:hypothetical protein
MTDRIDALERLARLNAEGALSDDEFAAQKAAVLASDTGFPGDGIEGATSSSAQHMLPWALGAMLMAALLFGGYLLATRSTVPNDAANVAATTVGNEVVSSLPGKPSATQGITPVVAADFVFTDDWLANERPNWETFNEGPNVIQFCAGDKAKLNNLMSKPMHLMAGVQESDVNWPIGGAKPDQVISFDVGDDPGHYYLGSIDDGQPYVPFVVTKCDAKRDPL